MTLGSIKVNPLQVVSAFFILLSPFLTWLTIVSVVIVQNFAVFGTASQSNLLQISSQQIGTNIPDSAAVEALLSAILLGVGGLVTLRNLRVGWPISALGLASFSIRFSPMFGASAFGAQQTFISPGIGFFLAAVGTAIGVISPATKTETTRVLIHQLKRGESLAKVGVFVGSVALTLDFLNHLALGQLPAFVGFGVVGQTLHLGLVVGVAGALLLVILGKRVVQDEWLTIAGVGTLVLLGIDASYNLLTGNLEAFLGHNSTETVLHLSVYYGVALLVVSRFLPRE